MSNIKMFKYAWVWEKSKGVGFINAKNAPIKFHEDILVFSTGNTANLNTNNMVYNPQGLEKCNRVRKDSELDKLSVVGTRPSRMNTNYIQDFTGYPKSTLYFRNETKSLHPTQKPVALFEYLIKTYTSVGDTILDNCIGSGTTAVAAINTGRNFIGIEMDKGYCDIANKRIQEAREKLASKF